MYYTNFENAHLISSNGVSWEAVEGGPGGPPDLPSRCGLGVAAAVWKNYYFELKLTKPELQNRNRIDKTRVSTQKLS